MCGSAPSQIGQYILVFQSQSNPSEAVLQFEIDEFISENKYQEARLQPHIQVITSKPVLATIKLIFVLHLSNYRSIFSWFVIHRGRKTVINHDSSKYSSFLHILLYFTHPYPTNPSIQFVVFILLLFFSSPGIIKSQCPIMKCAAF